VFFFITKEFIDIELQKDEAERMQEGEMGEEGHKFPIYESAFYQPT